MAQCSEELCGWVDKVDIQLGDLFIGHVWYCGDEYCNCSEAKITLRRKNEHGFGHVWECGDEYCNCSEAKITLRRKNHVWECGDEYCNCSEAKITLRRKNEHGFYNSHELWEGKFYTDGEGWNKTNTELNRMAAHLRRYHNEFFHRIQWPWSPT